MAQMLLPMLADPNVRKSSMSVVKWLMIFGGLGVLILAFVFLGKKFNPVKKVQDWLSGGLSSVTGAFGNFGKMLSGGILGTSSLITGSVTEGVDSIKKNVESKVKDVIKIEADNRRKLRRVGKQAVRQLSNLTKNKAMPKEVKKRASVMKTTLRRAIKKPSKKVSKKIGNIFAKKSKKKSKKKKKKKKRR